MKNLIIFTFIGFVWAGCSNNEPTSTPLSIEYYKLNQNCFSSQKLQQAEVVITTSADYQIFEDSIRRHFIASCDTTYLPAINFDSCFFVGKYTQASGCDVNYECKVLYQADEFIYNYIVTVTSIGTCEMLHTAFHCAIIPRQSEQINVQVQVKNQQQ